MKGKAIAVAFATTLLWSGSYIVNRWAFQLGMGAMTLAGFRYSLAAAAVFVFYGKQKRPQGAKLPFISALAIGMISYVVAQGLQYVGQSLLTPTQVSLLINAGMVFFIMAIDRLWLFESQKLLNYVKIAALGLGMVLYYTPWVGPAPSLIGIVLTVIASAGCGMNITINRYMLRDKGVDRVELTAKPMLCGGLVMLVVGLLTERLPALSVKMVGIVAYLAFVSGALGFSLWIWSQQWLSALESGSLNSLMLIETAALDAIVFGRVLTIRRSLAIILVFAAVVLIQMNRSSSSGNTKSRQSVLNAKPN
jgi:drug/metabolite transporter (DMT)-like permease